MPSDLKVSIRQFNGKFRSMDKVHIPQWGECCTRSVRRWWLDLICSRVNYTFNVVKRCTQIWVYLWATRKVHLSSLVKVKRCQYFGLRESLKAIRWKIICSVSLCVNNIHMQKSLQLLIKTHIRGLSRFGHTRQYQGCIQFWICPYSLWGWLLKHRFSHRNFAPASIRNFSERTCTGPLRNFRSSSLL